jgi:hypothetical protein
MFDFNFLPYHFTLTPTLTLIVHHNTHHTTLNHTTPHHRELIDERGGDLNPDENLLEVWVKSANIKEVYMRLHIHTRTSALRAHLHTYTYRNRNRNKNGYIIFSSIIGYFF